MSIRPLREDEYAGWQAASAAGYTRSMIEHGGIDPKRAHAKAERDYANILPNGLATQHHSIFAVEHEGAVAGHLWVAERDGVTGTVLFVYDISIDPAFQGQGLGRAAMLFAEEEARRRGLSRVELNVFGGNEVARGLYRSLGYAESAVYMVKTL